MSPQDEALRALAAALAPYLAEELRRLQQTEGPPTEEEIDSALAELGWERAK